MTNATWVGKTVADRYEIVELLGEGGMGQVYMAEDRNLRTHVVIKVPHHDMLADIEFRKRFGRETRSLVALSHPHVVKIQDVGEDCGVPFVVLQFLPGGCLHDHYSAGGSDPVGQSGLETWIEPIAQALDFIHRQGFVHRDVKPDNILFDVDGNPYVGDFGIAKSLGQELQNDTARLTQEGVTLGTPDYMAPEVILGEAFDGRADQYSLAATVYEMLCGSPPFAGRNAAAIIVQATTQSPLPPCANNPHVARNLSDVIVRALSKSAADRFPDCLRFAQAVLGAIRSPVLAGVPLEDTSAKSQPVVTPNRKRPRRRNQSNSDTAAYSGDTGLDVRPPGRQPHSTPPKPFGRDQSAKQPASPRGKRRGEDGQAAQQRPVRRWQAATGIGWAVATVLAVVIVVGVIQRTGPVNDPANTGEGTADIDTSRGKTPETTGQKGPGPISSHPSVGANVFRRMLNSVAWV